MPSAGLPGLTALLSYDLTGSSTAFLAAAERMVSRVEAEGDTGVLSYRFFLSGAEAQARAVVDYRDAAAWMDHHALIAGWPEFAALRETAILRQIDFLGPVPDDILSWLDRSGLAARVSHGTLPAAGFARPRMA